MGHAAGSGRPHAGRGVLQWCLWVASLHSAALMFSATFKRKVERLARDVLTDPVKVVQGDVGEANEDVTQIVLVVPSMPPTTKWNWLTNHLVEFTSGASAPL